MEELLEAIEQAKNVESLKFSKEDNTWELVYKNYGKIDHVKSEDLIDFLYNA